MKLYTKQGDKPEWVCGHWNGSPIEIGMGRRTEVGDHEALHHHPYREYYVMLEGAAELEVEGQRIALKPGMTAMVEPGERHMIVSVSEGGARWIVIGERSAPGMKFLA